MPDRDAARRVTAITAAAELGGTERVLLDLAVHAFEYGIALRVLTPRHGPLIDLLNNLGVPAEAVPAPPGLLHASQRWGHLHSIPAALLGLRRWARDLGAHLWYRDAEVVYSVAFKAHLASALSPQRPVLWHLHEFPPARTGRIWRFLSRRLPDAMIANSHAVREAWGRGRRRSSGKGKSEREKEKGERGDGKRETRHRGADAARSGEGGAPIIVIPNGVDLDRFEPMERTRWIHNELSIPWDARLVGMPAVFARWKGQLEVIEAFEMIAGEFPDVHLVLVGGTIYDTMAEREYGDALVGVIEGQGKGKKGQREGKGKGETEQVKKAAHARVHLLPFQHRVERVYPEFDLTLHYSTRPEPFGRVVIEAMACGVPVIAAAEGGPIEILGGGIGPRREAGWLVEPRDPGTLARILRSALELPPAVLRSIGDAGRRRAEDFFSARAFAERVCQVLGEMAVRKKGERGRGEQRGGRTEKEGR